MTGQPASPATAPQARRLPVAGLGTFFALMYFVQTLGDPSSGIIAQPVRSLLTRWGESPGDVALFCDGHAGQSRLLAGCRRALSIRHRLRRRSRLHDRQHDSARHRRAPLLAAATVFSLLMALSNLALSLSEAFGGNLYETVANETDATFAYRCVMLLSVFCPALCSLVMPALRRAVPDWFEPGCNAAPC